ncbi:hypothetical protein NEOKW01_1020 [Nematocida sp. AWRm80]|nr:hypothetical protein NEOKW01_1020 [Nematocida sp. AWRm80]
MNKQQNKVVVKLDQVTSSYAQLVLDCRKYFEPGVSRNLKEQRKWRVKDYVQLSRHFSSSHLFTFSQSEEHNNMKIISLLDGGSTYYFKINRYIHMSSIFKGTIGTGARIHGYFVIAHNIDKKDPIKPLMRELKEHSYQNQYTTRALMIKGIGEHNYIMTQYMIRKEEKPGRANLVKLSLEETGPRIEMKLQKIEEGICTGNVTFHSYIHKTEEELQQRDAMIREREALKIKRRMEQEENVRRKKQKNNPGSNTQEKTVTINDTPITEESEQKEPAQATAHSTEEDEGTDSDTSNDTDTDSSSESTVFDDNDSTVNDSDSEEYSSNVSQDNDEYSDASDGSCSDGSEDSKN